MKILVTGASGLVGRAIVERLHKRGDEVLKVTRGNASAPDQIKWNPESGFSSEELSRLENLDAVIHLAGENVADERWTEEKKRRIRESRSNGTRILVDALKNLKNPPKSFIAASAIGFYGNRGDEILTEESLAGEGFFPEVCKAWETESFKAKSFARVVCLRIGIVLSRDGGALAKMATPFKLGVGGKVGSGKQWMSWIAFDDLQSLIIFSLTNGEMHGAYNATAPNPATNEEFTSALGRVLNRPTFFSVPAFALTLLFGEMGEILLLNGCRVLPNRTLESGFVFEFPTLEAALRKELD